ncbi:MAG: rod-binding protein [Pseudobdellovibrio sp.]
MSDIKLNNTLRQPLTQADKTKAADDKLHEVSELYEKHFIREMMKQMRSTVQEGGFIQQNNAEKIFRDQLDDQYADQWTKSGGIGLSTLIYDQLIDKFGPQMGLKQRVDKPMGPIAMNDKTNFAGVTSSGAPAAALAEAGGQQGQKSSSQLTFKFQTPPNEKVELVNPWAGVLLDKKYMDMDQMQYRIKHDNGLESLILTRGTGLGLEQKLSPGDTIQAGQQLGWASSASPLFWTVKPNVSE